MMLALTDLEYNTFLALTFVLIAVKAILIAFLVKKVHEKIKETGKFTFGFVFSVFLLMICLLVARLIYMQFDFVLTHLDPDLYYQVPAIWYWKMATLVDSAGMTIFIYITDYRVFKFRFKGIPAYLLVGVSATLLFYPVNQKADFDFISTFAILADLIAIIVPVFFFYMGRKKSPYQVSSLLIAFGIIIYAIGVTITTESIVVALVSSFGEPARLVIYFLSLISKIIGLVMFSYGVSNFAIKFSK